MVVVMDDEIRALDLFIRKSSREAYPHGLPMDLNDPFCSYQHSTATSSSNTMRRVPASATCYIRAAALSHSLASPLPLVMPSLRRMNENRSVSCKRFAIGGHTYGAGASSCARITAVCDFSWISV